MNPRKLIIFIFILLALPLFIFSQEQIETKEYHIRFNPQKFLPETGVDDEYQLIDIKEKMKRTVDTNVFSGNWLNNFQPYSEKIKLFDNNTMYINRSSFFNTYSVSYPTMFGFDFHLKPLFKWNKLDIYFFGNGMFYNCYSIDGNNYFIDTGNRDFLWELGGGIEYEVLKNFYIFYDYSLIFKNDEVFTPKQEYKAPSTHRFGVRYKF